MSNPRSHTFNKVKQMVKAPDLFFLCGWASGPRQEVLRNTNMKGNGGIYLTLI